MRFRGLDLNLLAALAVLMEERSVSRAAARLHLSQPAVSGMLARLRAFFGDELLVLDGKRMLPTALAQTLTPQVEGVLQSLGIILDSSSSFAPASSSRTFRIAASDYIAMILIRPVLQRLHHAAPKVRVIIEQPGERTAARLEEGKLDLLITPEEYASPRHPLELAFEESHVAVGWDQNPVFRQPLTKAAFLSADHVGVMVGTDAPAAFADRQLEQLGVTRQVGITVADFAAVPWMVIGTLRIGLMHARLATAMSEFLPIATSALPFAFPLMREVLQYHRSRTSDPGLRWLREQLLLSAEGPAAGGMGVSPTAAPVPTLQHG